MNTAYFDIETTAVDDWTTLEGMDKIHCVSIGTDKGTTTFSGERVIEGIELLQRYDVIVGHNIINFDVPAIKKIYPNFKPKAMRDTYVMASSMFSDIVTQDRYEDRIPKELHGRHSLKAWGYRLDMLKGDYGDTTDWTECTPEMIEYCEQDVALSLIHI